MKKNNEKYAWITDISTYIEIVELAQKHGKKSGDDMTPEFIEIMKKKSHKVNFLGKTDKDIDLLTGDLREQGLNILNLEEEKRKKRKKK